MLPYQHKSRIPRDRQICVRVNKALYDACTAAYAHQANRANATAGDMIEALLRAYARRVATDQAQES